MVVQTKPEPVRTKTLTPLEMKIFKILCDARFERDRLRHLTERIKDLIKEEIQKAFEEARA